MATRRAQRYSTTYKKKESPQQDPYALARAPKEPAMCPNCKALYIGKRWVAAGERTRAVSKPAPVTKLLCPACRKVKDEYPEGIVTLQWADLNAHETEIRGVISNVEARAKRANPLQRVMRIAKRRNAMEIQTTTDHLAQSLGRALVRAFHGEVTYRFPHKDKLTRVAWTGPSALAR